MVGSFIDILNEVLIACVTTLGTHTASSLSTVLLERGALDITEVGDGDDHGIVAVEVLGVHLLAGIFNLGTALVAELLLDLNEFLLDDLAALGGIVEDSLQVLDGLAHLGQLVVQFLLLQAGELAQTHLDDGTGLHLGEAEALTQALDGVLGRVAALDDGDHLVDVVTGDDESFQDVGTLLGLLEVELGAADHHLVAVLQEVMQQFLEVQQHGTSVNQTHIINAERRLQLGHLIQLVEEHVGVEVLLDIDDDAHTVAVALVVDIGNALDLLLLNQAGNVLDEILLVDVIGNLVNDNALVVVLGLDLGLGTHDDASASCLKGVLHTLIAVDDTTRGEVGSLNVVHQVAHLHLGVLEQRQAAVDALTQVVGSHVGSHADSDTRCTVHQQVGDAGGQHRGLLKSVVEIGHKVNGVLVHVFHHALAHLVETHLGVTHGSRAVTVNRAEVTLAINQRVTHCPFLGQTDHGKINRRIAVGVVLTKHVTHNTGRFLVGGIGVVAQLVHAVEYPAVHGLEAVAHIG